MGSKGMPSSVGMPADVGPLGESVYARYWERPGNALSSGLLHTEGLPMAANRMTVYEMIRDAGPVARNAHWLTGPFWGAPTSRSQPQTGTPEEHPDTTTFRRKKRHLAFGERPHGCLGAKLGRIKRRGWWPRSGTAGSRTTSWRWKPMQG